MNGAYGGYTTILPSGDILNLLIILADTTGSRLDSEAFFLEGSLVGWDIQKFFIRLIDVDPVTGGVASITSLAEGTAVVPVPAAVWMFGSALLALAGFRKKNK